MGSRIVLPFGSSGEYIEKRIPDDDDVKQWNFPTLDEYYVDSDSVYKHAGKNNSIIWNAIEQQYNEWSAWVNSPETIKCFLAPIVHTYTDKNGLPVLCFPYFIPILDETQIFKYNDTEALLIAGKHLEQLHISNDDILKFYRELPTVIDFLNLVTADILNNPSNIGYNPIFGLRIIDYGLIH